MISRLVRFVDGRGSCWSRVDLTNGDPIWISVAQAGVCVKRSRLGVMGAKLFDESNVYRAAATAQLLDSKTSKYITPPEMKNPVLKAFTEAVLQCDSAAEVAIRLNEALRDAT